MRTCAECGEPVSGRRKRHPECKRAAHARAEKARRDAVKEQQESGRSDWYPESTAVGRAMVDYAAPNSAIKPPSFDGVKKPPRKEPVTEVVDYTKGGSRGPLATQARRYDLSGVNNAVRHDRVRLEREMVRQQLAAEENDLTSWDQLQAQGERLANTVDFRAADRIGLRDRPRYAITNHAAAGTLYGGQPDFGAAAAGQSVRRFVPRPKSGPQKRPHILN